MEEQYRKKCLILVLLVDQIKFQEAYLSLYQSWKHKQIGQIASSYLLYYWYFGMGFLIGNNWFAAGLIHPCMLCLHTGI